MGRHEATPAIRPEWRPCHALAEHTSLEKATRGKRPGEFWARSMIWEVAGGGEVGFNAENAEDAEKRREEIGYLDRPSYCSVFSARLCVLRALCVEYYEERWIGPLELAKNSHRFRSSAIDVCGVALPVRVCRRVALHPLHLRPVRNWVHRFGAGANCR